MRAITVLCEYTRECITRERLKIRIHIQIMKRQVFTVLPIIVFIPRTVDIPTN